MSTRKERRMKTAIDPLIKQVKDYVTQNEGQMEALGIVGKIKFHANVRTDKLKKEAQIIFTLAQGRVAKEVKEYKKKKAEGTTTDLPSVDGVTAGGSSTPAANSA